MSEDWGYEIEGQDRGYGECLMVPSAKMNRELPVLIFLPLAKPEGGKRFPTVYLLHGRSDQVQSMDEAALRAIYNPGTGLAELAEAFQVAIVAPVTGNYFYIDFPGDDFRSYATYVGEELPALIESRYPVETDRKGRILAGFSMGGHGAISLLCRYPHRFSVACSRAGLLDLGFGVVDENWDDALAQDALGSYWENAKLYHQNSCLTLIDGLREREDVGIVVECGREDFLYPCNLRFRDRVAKLGIPHIYAEYPGPHQWSRQALASLLGNLQHFLQTI